MQHLKCRSFSGATHSKLIHIGFPNNNPSQLPHSLHRGGVERRPVPLQDARPGRRRHVGGADVVLDAHEHAGEGAGVLSGGDLSVEAARVGEEDVVVGEVGLGEAEARRERRTWRMDRISDCGGGEGVREAREAREGARGLKCG